MRAVVQRVSWAEVLVEGGVVAAIEQGLLVLVGVSRSDGPEEGRALAAKLVGLRIFPDEAGKMNRSVQDAQGEVLVVSQFTLLGDARKGRRPSFIDAAGREEAEPLVEELARAVEALGVPSRTGRFGTHMEVHLVNEGPVTLVIDVADGKVV
ncbi:MAG: D-aminoacyl-tRNA deacylase [Actinomycetota bacterium]|nr:D-aminoacyl-tRNA deacylase [Actinomycetota bacterium]